MASNTVTGVLPQPAFAWHVTPHKNLASILESGLVPALPEPDGDLAVSLFKTRADAERETAAWLAKKFDFAPLVLLKVEISGLALTETFPFEIITTDADPIEPARIHSVERFLVLHDAAAALEADGNAVAPRLTMDSLGDVASARVEDGIDLYVEETQEDDDTESVRYVTVPITRQWLARILELRHVCIDHDIRMIEESSSPSHWVTDGDIDVRYCGVHVDDGFLCFHGTPDEGPEEVNSDDIPIFDLCSALAASRLDATALPDGFALYGGSILFSSGDITEFTQKLSNAQPELAAKELALTMADAIELAAQRSSPPKAARRRRAGV